MTLQRENTALQKEKAVLHARNRTLQGRLGSSGRTLAVHLRVNPDIWEVAKAASVLFGPQYSDKRMGNWVSAVLEQYVKCLMADETVGLQLDQAVERRLRKNMRNLTYRTRVTPALIGSFWSRLGDALRHQEMVERDAWLEAEADREREE